MTRNVFNLFDGSYVLRRRIGAQTFIVMVKRDKGRLAIIMPYIKKIFSVKKTTSNATNMCKRKIKGEHCLRTDTMSNGSENSS